MSSILTCYSLKAMRRNLVLEQMNVQIFAVFQEEICCKEPAEAEYYLNRDHVDKTRRKVLC